MFLRQLSLTLCFGFLTCSLAGAGEHAISVIAGSPAAIQSIGEKLPSSAQQQMARTLSSLAVPLANVISSQDALGVWLDYRGPLPEVTFFVQSPNLAALENNIAASGFPAKEIGNGIVEVNLGAKLYYRVSDGWLFMSASADGLQNITSPLEETSVPAADQIAIVLKPQHIPANTLSEVIKVLSLRLLPADISLAEPNSAGGILKLYAERMMQSLSLYSQQTTVMVSVAEQGLTLEVDVVNAVAERFAQQTSELMFPSAEVLPNALRVHIGLRDEEKPMLTWWAQSMRSRLEATLKEEAIVDRMGQTALLDATDLLARLVGSSARAGEIEALLGTVGDDEIPFVGVRVEEDVTNSVTQLLTSKAMKEFGLELMEGGVEEVGAFALQRFSIGEGDDWQLGVVAVGPRAIYLTMGIEGLKTLKQHLRESEAKTTQQAPLELRLKNVAVPNLIGNIPGEETRRDIAVSSRYTGTGMAFQIKIGGE